MVAALEPCIDADELLSLQQAVRAVYASPALYDYLQAIIAHTRQSPEFASGLSPRSGLNLLQAARAWAFLDGRDFVMPEDLQSVLPSVVASPPSVAAGKRSRRRRRGARQAAFASPHP